MVREWLQWVAGRPSTRRRRMAAAAAANGETSNSSGGCMCAVFQLFDLQHMHPFGYHPHPSHFLQQEAITTPKGVEAPRNSLELEETLSMKVASSMPLPIKEKQDNSNFLVGINKIKTRVDPKSRTEDNNNYSSDCSPGTTKTPSLVARLMGLDLLPESNNNSPSLSTSIPNPRTKNKSNNGFSNDDIAIGARSSAAARRSEFEYHRLSLQINKENKNVDEFTISSKTRGKSAKSENSSPAGHFAKQVVNQVKERVNRRGSGLTDITNTNYKDGFCRRDQNLVLNQPIKKLDPKKKIVASSGTKSPRNSTSSCEGNYEKKIGGGNGNTSSGVKKLQSGPQSCEYSVRAQKLASDKKAKILTDKKLGPLISGDIVNVSGPTTVLPVKKDPSPRATKLPQKQSQVSDALSSKRSTQLSCNQSRSYKQLSLHPDQISTVLPVPDKDNGLTTTAAAAAAAAYKDYVGKILKRAGINDKLTPLTLGKWRTASHPLDPSIFYYLELFYPGAAEHGGVMSRRSNRKLVFQLVDELLAEILKTHLDLKPRVDRLGLCDELCEKIGNFPAADCRVLEDIDLLIDRDLGESRLNGVFEEEGEGLVCEIESEIMEWLVHETVAAVVGVTEEEVKRKKKKKKKKKTESRQVPRVGEVCHVRRCY